LTERAAAHEALLCLQALRDSGADDAAVSASRALVARLADTPQSFAPMLRDVLTATLDCLTGAGAAAGSRIAPEFPSAFPDIPLETVWGAMAACHERGLRRPGEVVLSFAGDCAFGKLNGDSGAERFPAVYRRSGARDYPFARMRPWFRTDDLTVVNYEGTFTHAAAMADKQWHFQADPEDAAILPAGSVEIAGVSNNHAHDYLQAGFRDTVKSLKGHRVGLFYQGQPYVAQVRGTQIVLIGDCTVVGENTTVTTGVAERVLKEVRTYKRPDNLVVVVMHWGSELDTVPTRWQRDHGRQFIDAGADAVVGHHPHVIQGIEAYRGRCIAYSLGNFAFGGNSLARRPECFVLRLRFRSDRGKIVPDGSSIVPCFITSSVRKTGDGALRNNYQPRPVFERQASDLVAMLLARSAGLEHGLRRVDYFDPR